RDLRELVSSHQASLQRLRISKRDHAEILQEYPDVTRALDACSKKFSDITESLDRIGIDDAQNKRGVFVNSLKVTWNQKKIDDPRRESAEFVQILVIPVLSSVKFLASFFYEVMDARHSRIIHAHQETFRWIFQRPAEGPERWSNFQDWLKSDQKLYWVTGKAGSGKSTLMKFICGSTSQDRPTDSMEGPASSGPQFERCRGGLLEWAESGPLIIASFYFWATGDSLESSPKGLYQSLIF
ncbi:hypothetical protein CSAL01_13605, partial [Colletotrichum salicis]